MQSAHGALLSVQLMIFWSNQGVYPLHLVLKDTEWLQIDSWVELVARWIVSLTNTWKARFWIPIVGNTELIFVFSFYTPWDAGDCYYFKLSVEVGGIAIFFVFGYMDKAEKDCIQQKDNEQNGTMGGFGGLCVWCIKCIICKINICLKSALVFGGLWQFL